MKVTRITLFSLLMAWANLLHLLAYPYWLKENDFLGLLVLIASVFLAVKPSSVRGLVTLVVLRFVYTLYWMPMLRGHLFLEGLLCLGILMGMGAFWFRRRRTGAGGAPDSEVFFESFAPFLCVSSVVVYAAVTLPKLNTVYWALETCEAVRMHLWAHHVHSFVPVQKPVLVAVMWGTVLIEGGLAAMSRSWMDADFHAWCESILKPLDWHGPAAIQAIQDERDGAYKLIEVNGRFWGSLDFDLKVGFNVAALACDIAEGRPITPRIWGSEDSAYLFVLPRLVQVMKIDAEHRKAIARQARGMWRRGAHTSWLPGDLRPNLSSIWRTLTQLRSMRKDAVQPDLRFLRPA